MLKIQSYIYDHFRRIIPSINWKWWKSTSKEKVTDDTYFKNKKQYQKQFFVKRKLPYSLGLIMNLSRLRSPPFASKAVIPSYLINPH